MSIQIIVTSPYQYFSEWIGDDNPKKNTECFIDIIKNVFDIELNKPLETKEYYCEDLLSNVSLDLSALAYNISQEIQWQQGADFYLPYNFKGIKRLSIPCLDKENDLMVCSTEEFSKAIKIIEEKISSENNNDIKFGEILTSYKEAISISNEVKQPIFWSY